MEWNLTESLSFRYRHIYAHAAGKRLLFSVEPNDGVVSIVLYTEDTHHVLSATIKWIFYTLLGDVKSETVDVVFIVTSYGIL